MKKKYIQIVEKTIEAIAITGCIGIAMMLLSAPMWQAMAYYKFLCVFMTMVLTFPAYIMVYWELNKKDGDKK